MLLSDMKRLLGTEILPRISSIRYSYAFHRNFQTRNVWAVELQKDMPIEYASRLQESLLTANISGCKPRVEVVSERELEQELVENLWPTGQTSSAIFYNIPTLLDPDSIHNMLSRFKLQQASSIEPIEKLETFSNSSPYKVTFADEVERWNAYADLHTTSHFLPDGSNFCLKIEPCK